LIPSHENEDERLVAVPDGSGYIMLTDGENRLIDMFCKLTRKSREQVIADALTHWLEGRTRQKIVAPPQMRVRKKETNKLDN
jgi:hypothetical protein